VQEKGGAHPNERRPKSGNGRNKKADAVRSKPQGICLFKVLPVIQYCFTTAGRSPQALPGIGRIQPAALLLIACLFHS